MCIDQTSTHKSTPADQPNQSPSNRRSPYSRTSRPSPVSRRCCQCLRVFERSRGGPHLPFGARNLIAVGDAPSAAGAIAWERRRRRPAVRSRNSDCIGARGQPGRHDPICPPIYFSFERDLSLLLNIMDPVTGYRGRSLHEAGGCSWVMGVGFKIQEEV